RVQRAHAPAVQGLMVRVRVVHGPAAIAAHVAATKAAIADLTNKGAIWRPCYICTISTPCIV
ncbi:MAG: hypothetical protein ACMG50_11240, partial [Thermomonas sp.]